MPLKQITDKLRHIENNRFVLDRACLQSDAIVSLWQRIFSVDKLILKDVVQINNNGYCHLEASICNLPGFDSHRLNVILFTGDKENTETVIYANRINQWNIVESFPEMPQYLSYDPIHSESVVRPNIFNEFSICDMPFVFSSCSLAKIKNLPP